MVHISHQFAFAVMLCAAATNGASVADTESIFLRLYVGASMDEYIDYSLENVGAIPSKLIDNRPTVLYIHGFTEHLQKKSVRTVVEAYLKRNDHNIIGVDYGKLSNESYPVVVSNGFQVATFLVESLNRMIKSGFDPEKLHIVGHSLGAQIAGIVGRGINIKIPRITGLDPAGPAFNMLITRLSSSDARFVDIIHTDYGFYGIARTTGTVDFFPNGGSRLQPGCSPNATFFSKEDFCSHHRSWVFYAESLSDESAFSGVQCPSQSRFSSGQCNNNTLVIMGYATPSNVQGSIYLVTDEHSPFGLRRKGAFVAVD